MNPSIKQKKERIKDVKKASNILIVLCLVVVIFLPTSYAKEDGMLNFLNYMVETINTGVFETIEKNLSPSGEDEEINIYDYVTDEDEIKKSVIGTFSNAIIGLGICMMLIYAAMRLFQNLERGQDELDAILQFFTEWIFGVILAINIGKLMSILVTFGTVVISAMGDAVKDSPGFEITLQAITGKEKGGFLWKIQTLFMLFFPYIASLLLSLVAKFVAYSILLELGIRRAFAPIAIADIFGEGLRSPGVRSMKKYLAVFFKIAICLLVCKLGNEMISLCGLTPDKAEDVIAAAGNAVTGTFNYLFSVIVIEFTCVGVMFKGGEYANDVLGV